MSFEGLALHYYHKKNGSNNNNNNNTTSLIIQPSIKPKFYEEDDSSSNNNNTHRTHPGKIVRRSKNSLRKRRIITDSDSDEESGYEQEGEGGKERLYPKHELYDYDDQEQDENYNIHNNRTEFDTNRSNNNNNNNNCLPLVQTGIESYKENKRNREIGFYLDQIEFLQKEVTRLASMEIRDLEDEDKFTCYLNDLDRYNIAMEDVLNNINNNTILQ